MSSLAYLSPLAMLLGAHKQKPSSGNSPFGMKAPKGYDIFSTLNPDQQGIFQQLGMMGGGQGNQLFQQGQGFLQNLFSNNQQATQAFEQPYLSQFQQQTIPQLAERFAGLGAGAQSSSAFQNALGQAGAGLQEQLAALRGGMQMQGLGQAFNFSQAPFNNLRSLLDVNTLAYSPKQPGFLKQLGLSAASGVGQAAGMLPFLL